MKYKFTIDEMTLYNELWSVEEIMEDLIDIAGAEVFDFPELINFKTLDWSNAEQMTNMADVLTKLTCDVVEVEEDQQD